MISPPHRTPDQSPVAIITCEHGGNHVPDEYQSYFSGAEAALNSHRGWDLGALDLAQQLANTLRFPLYFSTTTRLLIDLNRSVGQADLFSEWSRSLNESERSALIAGYYSDYRQEIEAVVKKLSLRQPVIHLSMHSFTPIWNSVPRTTEIGILFDPTRTFETSFCQAWRVNLAEEFSELVVELNQPYQGTADGLTTYLRTQLADVAYAGIELEVNQKLLMVQEEAHEFARRLIATTAEVFQQFRE